MGAQRYARAQKRRGNDIPPWMTEDIKEVGTITASSQAPRHTDGDGDYDNDDYTNQPTPSSTATWQPATGVYPPLPPLVVSISWTVVTLETSVISSTSHRTTPEANAMMSLRASVTQSADVAATVYPNATGTVFPEVGSEADHGRKEVTNHVPVYAVAGAVPIAALAIIGFAIFFCMRRRRRRRQAAAGQNSSVPEMKFRQPVMHQHTAPEIPTSRAPSYTTERPESRAPSYTPPAHRPASPPPVILGPISGNYMTGIDTSDAMSTQSIHNERTGMGDPFADGSSLNEEPPPPYRSPSLLSRNGSLRMPRSSMSVSSQHSRQSSQRHTFRPLPNPFEDPREDDAISALSGPRPSGHSNLSVVSDLSYQQDPQVDR